MVTSTHPVVLRGPRALGEEAPFVAQRSDDGFLPAMLQTLGRADDWTALADDATPVENGEMTLFQPVQRTFHVALVEAYCATLGRPRLDPARVESAGLVIRRITEDGGREAWGRIGESLVGWQPLTDLDADPDPARRPTPRTGVAALDARLAAARRLRPALSESIVRLFAAPPATAEATGRTLLYGIVPTTSTEMTEPGPVSLTDAEVRAAVPPMLAPQPGTVEVPDIGVAADASTVARADLAGDSAWQTFIGLLQQLAVQFDAFEDDAISALFAEALDPIELEIRPQGRVPMWFYLKWAARVLVYGGPGSVQMPARWPAIDQAAHARVITAVQAGLDKRFGQVAPRQQRFGRADARYRMRAFVRVRSDHEGCPPTLVWSVESAPFTIARWFEQGPVKPVPIELPEVGDVMRLAPNVTFAVPPGLFETLKALKLDKLMDGDVEEKPGSGLGWICGFNIPIITICAFILLFIILALLHIVFWWLPFVKVCLPVPQSLRGDR